MQLQANAIPDNYLLNTGDVVIFRNGKPYQIAESASGWYLVDKQGKINGAVGRQTSQRALTRLAREEGQRVYK
jgi:hypothetical protein